MTLPVLVLLPGLLCGQASARLPQATRPAFALCSQPNLRPRLARHAAVQRQMTGAQRQTLDDRGQMATLEQPQAMCRGLPRWRAVRHG